jgi:tetratricopeptide (TPR) repeat protein
MSFLSIPPNFILAKPVEQTLSSKNNFSKSLFKKRNLFYFSESKAVTNFELFLSDSSNLHVYKGFKVINNHKTFNFNGVKVHVASQESNHTKESVFNILLENYFKTETSNEIKSMLKKSEFSMWSEKELYSFWTKNLVEKNAEIADLIELLDTDIYSNEALIALGEKLLKTIKNKPNKFQNLFNIYFKMGNCYFYNNEPKKALKFYKKAAVFLNYIDVHHHFLFYLNLAKTKKSIGLVTEIEDRNVIYFYLSKESWEKKLYKNDLKEYFQFSA